MQKVCLDMIYLAACGVNRVKPCDAFLKEIKAKGITKEEGALNESVINASYMEKLYQMSKVHMLEALVGMTLQQSQISLPKEWTEKISKAVRKNILFDAERKKIFSFMEQEGIWYMPLKGILLKDYYPAVGMRQMSDNDILFDDSFSAKIKEFMKFHGYEEVSVGQGNHDVYEKEPVYNFEMHRALYIASQDRNWEEYYRDIKKRLIRNNALSYGYHFRDEDFYVYIVCHTYKHYVGRGTGLRSLLDFYVYLTVKEQEMDLGYVKKECEVLGIAEFEEKSRRLCKKVFSVSDTYDMETFMKGLSEEEKDMLMYYSSSGVYGNTKKYVINRIKEKGKVGFLISRIFMPFNDMKNVYPILGNIPVLLPIYWVVRIVKMVFVKKRRRYALGQFRVFFNTVMRK